MKWIALVLLIAVAVGGWIGYRATQQDKGHVTCRVIPNNGYQLEHTVCWDENGKQVKR